LGACFDLKKEKPKLGVNQGQLNEKAHTEKQHASPCSSVALGETDGPYSRPMTIFHHLSQSAAPSHWAVTFPNKEQTNKSHKSTASALHCWLNIFTENYRGQQKQRLLCPYSNTHPWGRRWDLHPMWMQRVVSSSGRVSTTDLRSGAYVRPYTMSTGSLGQS